jgi:hypothetical protein
MSQGQVRPHPRRAWPSRASRGRAAGRLRSPSVRWIASRSFAGRRACCMGRAPWEAPSTSSRRRSLVPKAGGARLDGARRDAVLLQQSGAIRQRRDQRRHGGGTRLQGRRQPPRRRQLPHRRCPPVRGSPGRRATRWSPESSPTPTTTSAPSTASSGRPVTGGQLQLLYDGFTGYNNFANANGKPAGVGMNNHELRLRGTFLRGPLVVKPSITRQLLRIQRAASAAKTFEEARATATWDQDLSRTVTTARVETEHAAVRGIAGKVGVEYQHQRGVTRMSRIEPSSRIDNVAAFAFEEYRLPRVTLSAGARYDTRQQEARIGTLVRALPEAQRAAALDRTFSVLNGSLGAGVRLTSGLTWTTSVNSGFRAPAIQDLYTDENRPRLRLAGGESHARSGAVAERGERAALPGGARHRHDHRVSQCGAGLHLHGEHGTDARGQRDDSHRLQEPADGCPHPRHRGGRRARAPAARRARGERHGVAQREPHHGRIAPAHAGRPAAGVAALVPATVRLREGSLRARRRSPQPRQANRRTHRAVRRIRRQSRGVRHLIHPVVLGVRGGASVDVSPSGGRRSMCISKRPTCSTPRTATSSTRRRGSRWRRAGTSRSGSRRRWP